jgi:hypothetical protein
VGSITANSEAQKVPSFRCWRLEMKLYDKFGDNDNSFNDLLQTTKFHISFIIILILFLIKMKASQVFVLSNVLDEKSKII